MALWQNGLPVSASRSGSSAKKQTSTSRATPIVDVPQRNFSSRLTSTPASSEGGKAKRRSTNGLEDLEEKFVFEKQEEKRLKEECQGFYSATQQTDKETADYEKEITKLERTIQKKQKRNQKVASELHLLQSSNQALRGQMVHASASSRVLDPTFGPHYQELQLLLEECNWDMDLVKRLFDDRAKLEKKLDYLQDKANKDARSAQFAQMALKNRELKAFYEVIFDVVAELREAFYWLKKRFSVPGVDKLAREQNLSNQLVQRSLLGWAAQTISSLGKIGPDLRVKQKPETSMLSVRQDRLKKDHSSRSKFDFL